MTMPASSEVRALLEGVRALLAEPERWTRRASARTHPHGKSIPFNDPRATCWCLSGAMGKVSAEMAGPHDTMEIAAMRRVAEAIQSWSGGASGYSALETVLTFNDAPGRRHSTVLAILDGAIAAG